MNSQTIHKKIVGKIQLNTFAYEKEVFKIIVDRLIQSNIFHSVCTQRINHCPANGKRNTCNCDEILEFIAKEFRAEAERFAQLFVPLIIVDYHSKIRHYLICELLYFYDKLLKPRKEFFLDDVKEKALFKSSKYRENCVCQLHEILSLENNSSASAKHCHASKVNNTCLHEVMKELVAHKLLPLSSKYLPLNSFRLQKILDICNKYYLPDSMIVRILNNLRAVKSDRNQAGVDTARFSDPSLEYDVFGTHNHNKAPFDGQTGEMRSGSVTSGKCQPYVAAEETNSSNINSTTRVPHPGSAGPVYLGMENGHNKSYASVRHSKPAGNDSQSYRRSGTTRDPTAWKNYNVRSYRPTSQRTSMEPQVSSNRRSNFHWQVDSPSRMSRRPSYQQQSDAYLNYSDYREASHSSAGRFDNGDRYNPTQVYEVVIDDECCDLDNVSTITVRDGDGNCRTYIDCDQVSSSMRRPPADNYGQSAVRQSQKRVSFAPPSECATETVARAVLCQEASSMDALLAVLDRQVDKEDMQARQCMRLSVRAEHVIRRPDCPGEVAQPRHADECLTISSEVQAKWENLLNEERSQLSSLSHGLPRQMSSHPGTFNRATSPLDLSPEGVAELCDKAMQTEKFLFLETCTERIVMSPNSIDCRNPAVQSVAPGASTSRGTEPWKSTTSVRPLASENAAGQFYFYEDRDKRLICSPSDLCVDTPTQTGEPPPSLYAGSSYRPQGYLKLPERNYVPPSVGNYYTEQQRYSDELASRYNVSIREDPRFRQSTYIGPDTPGPASTSYYEPHDASKQSRMYSLKPYADSVAPPAATSAQQNQQNHQINYSSSTNMGAYPSRCSPEDIYYIESRKLSPIIDVATYCQYTDPLATGQHRDSNPSTLRLRNAQNDKERNAFRRPLRYLNSVQQNNSNVICRDAAFGGSRHRIGLTRSPTTTSNRYGSRENVSGEHMLSPSRKMKSSHKSMKITKYVIDYPLRNTGKVLNRRYMSPDKIKKLKTKIKWDNINSTIPIIPSIDKHGERMYARNENTQYFHCKKSKKHNEERHSKCQKKNTKVHSNSYQENINPYEKSLDYFIKKKANKMNTANKTPKCFSNNYQINLIHSFPNINKKSDLDEMKMIKEKKKTNKKSSENMDFHEKLHKSTEKAKFIVLKYDVDMNCDSNDLKPIIYKYQPGECKFSKVKPLKIGKFKPYCIQNKKYRNHSLERKISEVEVDFNPI